MILFFLEDPFSMTSFPERRETPDNNSPQSLSARARKVSPQDALSLSPRARHYNATVAGSDVPASPRGRREVKDIDAQKEEAKSMVLIDAITDPFISKILPKSPEIPQSAQQSRTKGISKCHTSPHAAAKLSPEPAHVPRQSSPSVGRQQIVSSAERKKLIIGNKFPEQHVENERSFSVTINGIERTLEIRNVGTVANLLNQITKELFLVYQIVVDYWDTDFQEYVRLRSLNELTGSTHKFKIIPAVGDLY